MNPELLALVINLISLAIQHGPELVAEGEMAISLLQSGGDPTPEQQAQIRAALAKADAVLAKAIADKLG